MRVYAVYLVTDAECIYCAGHFRHHQFGCCAICSLANLDEVSGSISQGSKYLFGMSEKSLARNLPV